MVCVFIGFAVGCAEIVELTDTFLVLDHVHDVLVLVFAGDVEGQFVEEITNVSVTSSNKKFFYDVTVPRHYCHVQRSHAEIYLLFVHVCAP